MTFYQIIIFGFMIIGTSFGRAETASLKSSPAVPTPKIIFKKSESHRFSGAELKGQLKKPDLSYIYERRGLRQDKVVDVPDNFDEKIIAVQRRVVHRDSVP